jgi:hypothetical protein
MLFAIPRLSFRDGLRWVVIPSANRIFSNTETGWLAFGGNGHSPIPFLIFEDIPARDNGEGSVS